MFRLLLKARIEKDFTFYEKNVGIVSEYETIEDAEKEIEALQKIHPLAEITMVKIIPYASKITATEI